ncbi:SAM-dependent methyltransferase [Hydrogenophaga atypica]|uniref:SAM-dependent methyltransferase n=1 Tax=Hydrogenophaga atypica TaxID=249409 RepID=A0ABW2QSB5_9BURK
MNFWDHNFSGAGYKYGTAPNAFIAAEAHRLARGSRVLVPGDGEGRNGVWLAQQGHDVTAVDYSQVGLDKARALAAQRGVTLHTELADLTEWEAPAQLFDALALVFVHLPTAIRAQVHQRLLQALKPGGLVLIEAFTPKQLHLRSGGPKDVAMLYTLDLLRADFAAETRELMSLECETHLDEGPGHQGPAHVVRGVWQKC